MSKPEPISETNIIQHYFAPLAENTQGAFDLSDDAGLISAQDGKDLVLTTDMIIEGVHYLDNAAPQDIAYKALGVNVSDLCAKGADPSVYLLSISLSGTPDPKWLDGLSEGFAEAQSDFGCTLLGGDTVRTPGPVVLSITAAGFIPKGAMVHRSSARAGDHVYVTGTIGDAALGLALLKGAGVEHLSSEQETYLQKRYWRPQPCMDAISIVRAYANAAMDISDGLVGDFTKLCAASEVGGVLNAAEVPLSDAAAHWLTQEPERLSDILTGGDDYELLMSVSQETVSAFESNCASSGLQILHIGRIAPFGDGVRVMGQDGNELKFDLKSYQHF